LAGSRFATLIAANSERRVAPMNPISSRARSRRAEEVVADWSGDLGRGGCLLGGRLAGLGGFAAHPRHGAGDQHLRRRQREACEVVQVAYGGTAEIDAVDLQARPRSCASKAATSAGLPAGRTDCAGRTRHTRRAHRRDRPGGYCRHGRAVRRPRPRRGRRPACCRKRGYRPVRCRRTAPDRDGGGAGSALRGGSRTVSDRVGASWLGTSAASAGDIVDRLLDPLRAQLLLRLIGGLAEVPELGKVAA
jgi:hypothetical protein